MIKKELIVVLAILCLTATLFFVVKPTKSQTASQYDPWLDIDDNGHIDGADIASVAAAFGAGPGDPTKNVYVTNPSYDAETKLFNISWSNYNGGVGWGCSCAPEGYGWTGGYSRMFIHLYVEFISPKLLGEIDTTIYVSEIEWNCSLIPAATEHFEPNRCNATIYSTSQLSPIDRSGLGEFEIKAESVDDIFFNVTSMMESGWIQVEAWAYLRHE
jgi:hypothetical protein